MRKRGYVCEVTEHWCPFSKRRKDLFGVIDILCVSETDLIGVQTTSGANHSARKKKIAENETMKLWRKHAKIVLHSWKKYKNRWTLREEDL